MVFVVGYLGVICPGPEFKPGFELTAEVGKGQRLVLISREMGYETCLAPYNLNSVAGDSALREGSHAYLMCSGSLARNS